MTGWLPPLPLLGEGGWGGEGRLRVFPFGVKTPTGKTRTSGTPPPPLNPEHSGIKRTPRMFGVEGVFFGVRLVPFGLKTLIPSFSPKGFIPLAEGFNPVLFGYVIKFSFLNR